MVLTKEQKKSLLEQLNDRFLRSKAAVFTNYQGLKVTDLNLLRGKLKEKGIDYKVVKNTLVKTAALLRKKRSFNCSSKLFFCSLVKTIDAPLRPYEIQL